jgi:hypothetical protein
MRLRDRWLFYVVQPMPLRTLVLRRLLRRFPIGSFEARLRAGGVPRPHYAWCMYYAAIEAKALGHCAVTIVELGVAGGNGLVCLCQLRREIQKVVGIEIVVAGFDSGEGLPASDNPLDMLYCWPGGSYRMDKAALEKRVAGQAEVVLGDVSKTIALWHPAPGAPLGAVMFDLDYYTSTSGALAILSKKEVLPRVWCWFDDICAGPEEAPTDRIGEREAIRQFNLDPRRGTLNDHLSPTFAFASFAPESWHQQIYLYQRLEHQQYSKCIVGAERDTLRLVGA